MTTRREEWLDFWERRELSVLTALPYVLVVLCAVADAVGDRAGAGGWPIDLALVAAAIVLMASIDLRDRRSAWTDPQVALPTAAAALAFVVIALLSVTLVIRNPLFGFYVFTGYFWAFRLLAGRARFAGVALVAVPVALSQTGAGPYRDAGAIAAVVAVYLVNVGVAGTLTWFAWVGDEQHGRRAQEVTDLTEANAKLERAMQENAELQEQLVGRAREAGVAEERRRMAREIHDTIAQGLAGIVTQLQAAQGAIKGSEAEHVATAIDLARSSLREARRSVQALAPAPLADARLAEAVREVAERWAALHGVPVSVTTTGEIRPMRPELEVALVRTAQEALTNVAKHAHANRVGLTLSYMDDRVTLDVRDDGIGFHTVNGSSPRRPRDDAGGFGLIAMRQRVEGVAGTLEIESELDRGTAISASVPAVPA